MSIALTYSRSDKAIDLSWTLAGISATKNIILLTDTQDKASKTIVLDPGTESYTVETDDYFVANPSGTYHFVVKVQPKIRQQHWYRLTKSAWVW